MVADAYDAVSTVDGVRHVEIVLDEHFAADAIKGSTGTAAASQPSVNPGSLQPQFRQVSSDATDNKGYRALAALLLAALLFWAWRQAVPPRAGRRTIYDGPPAAA